MRGLESATRGFPRNGTGASVCPLSSSFLAFHFPNRPFFLPFLELPLSRANKAHCSVWLFPAPSSTHPSTLMKSKVPSLGRSAFTLSFDNTGFLLRSFIFTMANMVLVGKNQEDKITRHLDIYSLLVPPPPIYYVYFN